MKEEIFLANSKKYLCNSDTMAHWHSYKQHDEQTKNKFDKLSKFLHEKERERVCVCVCERDRDSDEKEW